MLKIERNTHYNCMACKDRMSDYKIVFGGQRTCQNYINEVMKEVEICK